MNQVSGLGGYRVDAQEKQRLKKLGKQLVEQQSKELRQQLCESNPALVGSDEWVRNYKMATERERRLRHDQPDHIHAQEAADKFILHPVKPSPLGVPTWYIECPHCGDLLHSVPSKTTACSCGSVTLDVDEKYLRVIEGINPRWVKLIGRGQVKRRPWWRIW